jgi:predicted pyridoxine 5'-phosphate oxidase superfamily flavin-nucleotide-binding protein
MGILTDDMRWMVDEQQLGFIATVCPDGTPNLSPKGTTAAWDDERFSVRGYLLAQHRRKPAS